MLRAPTRSLRCRYCSGSRGVGMALGALRVTWQPHFVRCYSTDLPPGFRAHAANVASQAPAGTDSLHEELIAVLVATHNTVADDALPQRLPGPLNSEQRNLLKKVKAEARRIAGTLGMAPEAILPSKDYELLIREAQGETFDLPGQWGGWREQQVIAPLRQFLSGNASTTGSRFVEQSFPPVQSSTTPTRECDSNPFTLNVFVSLKVTVFVPSVCVSSPQNKHPPPSAALQ